MANDLSRDLAALRIDESQPRGPRSWTWLLWAAGLLGLVVASSLGLLPYARTMLEQTEVETTQIFLGAGGRSAVEAAGVQLVASGYVVPRITSTVGAKVEGRIDRVHVEQGDVVKQGEVLFELDDANQEHLVAGAQARLTATRARAARQRVSLRAAKRARQREQLLFERGVASSNAVEDLETRVQLEHHSYSLARAEVAEAEARLAELVTELEHNTILAPIDGTVVSDPADVGQVVSPLTSSLLEIADMSSVVVEVDVPEGRMGKIRLGGPCSIVLDAYADRAYEGEVLGFSPVVNRAKATVIARIRFIGSHEGVLPNMAARVSFLAEKADVADRQAKLAVPASAIAERDGTTVVFVIDDERVRIEPIEIGSPLGGGFELIAGPAQGTRVVSSPPEGLTNGQRIRDRTNIR